MFTLQVLQTQNETLTKIHKEEKSASTENKKAGRWKYDTNTKAVENTQIKIHKPHKKEKNLSSSKNNCDFSDQF